MKVSFSWLKEYLELDLSPEKVADAMTLAGLEVDGIDGDIFEIGLTPNLGHCMSVIGIARELSAVLQIPLKRKEIVFEESGTKNPVSVEIEARDQCEQYLCRLVKGVHVGPSPSWLQKKLEGAGLGSVNNVVDVGNLVMLECGQPLHLFDFDEIGEKVVVKAATGGSMVSLDEMERQVPEGVLMVYAGKRPVAFAGVMGELESAIKDETRDVLIEAAQFTPQAVRKTSKLLNLRTDSSLRFERGIDPLGVQPALDMAAQILADIAEGEICKGTARCVVKEYQPRTLLMRPEKANQLLGIDLSAGEMCQLLERLEIGIVDEAKIEVQVPSYRNDLCAEIDLIEEVGRMYGFNNIPRNIPRHASSLITHSPLFLFEEEVRAKLIGLGLQECLTCDLISPKLAELTAEKRVEQISVLHPASVDQSVLRSSLLPGLLEVIKFNLDRQNFSIAGFEVGHIHFKDGENFLGEPALGIMMTGKNAPYHFENKPEDVDFFDLKGAVENILVSVGLEEMDFASSHLQNFHPGRQARVSIGDVNVGVLGEVHPQHLRALGIGQRVFYAEINLHDLMDLKPKHHLVKAFSLFPGSRRDWTLTLEEKTSIGSILDAIGKFSSPLLEKVFLLDLYKSEKIGKDRKNATFRFQYRDREKTVEYDEVEKEHKRLTQHIAEKLSNSVL
ncbi:MAG: Phenylalanine--tRNA ligase beta subunit [Chlamydiae bacterium]|nr:Phenylalanine--tRNA ligase beta subunit [Chlamydiota bacterium]